MNQAASPSAPSSALAANDTVPGQLIAAALLGLVILYGVAFAPTSLLHNATHDVRHVSAMPCH